MPEPESGGMTREREAELRGWSKSNIRVREIWSALDATRKLLDAEKEAVASLNDDCMELVKQRDAEQKVRNELDVLSSDLGAECKQYKDERDAARRELEALRAGADRYWDENKRLSERHEALRGAVEKVHLDLRNRETIGLDGQAVNALADRLEALATDEPEAPAPGGGECVACADREDWGHADGCPNKPAPGGGEEECEPCTYGALELGPVHTCKEQPAPACPVEDELREIAEKIPEGEWPAKERPVSVYCKECRGHFLPPHEHEEVKT